MGNAHRFLGACHCRRDVRRVGHLDRDRCRGAPAVQHFIARERNEGEGVKGLTENASLGSHDTDDLESGAAEAYLLADGTHRFKQLVGDLRPKDDDGAALFLIAVCEWASAGDAIVLHLLIGRRDTPDGDVSHRPILPLDIGERCRESRRDRHRLRVGERGANHFEVRLGEHRPPGDPLPHLVVEEADLDWCAPYLERVGPDQGAGDVVLDVGIHALDDRHDSDQEGHGDNNAEQREERPQLVDAELVQRRPDDITEPHIRRRLAAVRDRSLVPERLDRIHPRCARGRHHAEGDAGEGRRGECGRDG